MINKQFTQAELDALYDCTVYLMECEQRHYEESLQDEDESLADNHVYVKALDAFNALNRTEVTA
jgi:hypothetical protein